jgi:hypothetical protein
MRPNRDESLAIMDTRLEDVHSVAPLASHPEATWIHAPDRLAWLQSIHDSLGNAPPPFHRLTDEHNRSY